MPIAEDIKRAQRRGWTCALENFAGVHGTGALIGANLVLTNYHVVEKLWKAENRALAGNARARFDHIKGHGGRAVLLAGNWMEVASSYANWDLNQDEAPQPDCLDFAVIRLAEKIGDEHMPAIYGYDMTNILRGWVTLPAPGSMPEVLTPIDLYHHPCDNQNDWLESRPQPDIALRGVIKALEIGGLRITHNALTERGSSGAVCYGRELEALALHHAGDPHSALASVRNRGGKPLPPGQRAIPLGKIAQYLYDKHRSIWDETLPPAEQSGDPEEVPLGFGADAQAKDVLEDRHDRAMMLLDRDGAASEIVLAGRGGDVFVHAVACRDVDVFKRFAIRLREVNLVLQRDASQPIALKDSIARLLSRGWSELGWDYRFMRPNPSDSAPDTVRSISYEIEWNRSEGRGTLFTIARTLQDLELDRERKIISEVSQYCVNLGPPKKFQVIFLYEDKASSTQRDLIRNTLWQPPPPGCGKCVVLEDIGEDDVQNWISTVNLAYTINRQQLEREMADLFKSRSFSFLQLENKMKTITEKYMKLPR